MIESAERKKNEAEKKKHHAVGAAFGKIADNLKQALPVGDFAVSLVPQAAIPWAVVKLVLGVSDLSSEDFLPLMT